MCHDELDGGELHGNISRNGYGNAIIGRYGGCFEEDIRRFMCHRAYHITGFGCTGEVCANSQCEKGQCSNNDDHHTSIDLQLKNYNSILEQNMTLYECLRWCTGICNESRVTCMKEL